MKTTHIGSLPFLTIEDAIDFNRGLSLPCLPTLPLMDQNEWMIAQFTSGLMKMDHKLSFSCFEAFFSEFKGRVKVQVCGIQTLFNNLPKTSTSIDIDDFINWYFKVVNSFVSIIPNDFVLFFDEPDLRNLNTKLWSTYSEFEAELGIHSCAKGDWTLLNLKAFKHISFDSKLITEKEIKFLRENGKTLYCGGINSKNGKVLYLKSENDFLTPSCGLALTELDMIKKIRGALN